MTRLQSTGAIRTAIHAMLFVFAFWVTMAGPSQFSPTPAFAEGSCTVQANQCGCATCGCGGIDIPKQPSCPPGQQLYDDYCLPSCPDGWKRYPGKPGLCTPPCEQGCPEGWDQVPLPQCPDGYYRDITNPDFCAVDQDRLRDADNCPDGMSYRSDLGQCAVDCPTGYYNGANGLCQSYVEKECPQGYGRDPESGRCTPPGVWPPGYQWICLPKCPPGYLRDINQPTRCIPPPERCPDFYEPYEGKCVPVCEEGTQRDPYGYCVPPRCPEGTYPNLRGQCQEPECPPGSDNVRGQCVPPCDEGYSRGDDGQCVPPDDACPPDTERFNGQCMPPCERGTIRDDSGECVPPDDGCEPGTELFRGQCVPPCERGTLRDSNGRCVPTGCPQGEVKFSGKCVPRCPPDQLRDNNGRCVCPRGTDTFQGKCVPICRQGLVRNDNGRCVCPRGTDFFNGKCVPECERGLIRDNKGRCLPRACEDGLTRFQGKCVPECKRTFVRANNGRCVCPKGLTIGNSGFCERIILQRLCPKGFQRNEEGDCERIRLVPTACPEGYFFSKRYQKCILDEPDQPETPILKRPQLQINPELLQQLLVPQKKPRLVKPQVEQPQDDGGVNTQVPCPKGFFRDPNGRCVEG